MSGPRRVGLLAAVAFAAAAFAADPAERVFELAVENGRVPKAMQVVRVTQGERVRLRFSTDRPIALHLHGYDIERALASGAVTEIAFRAHATGRFALNVHEPGPASGRAHGERALLYLEVHPR